METVMPMLTRPVRGNDAGQISTREGSLLDSVDPTAVLLCATSPPSKSGSGVESGAGEGVLQVLPKHRPDKQDGLRAPPLQVETVPEPLQGGSGEPRAFLCRRGGQLWQIIKGAHRGNGKCSSLRRTCSKSVSDRLSERENNCVLIGLLTETGLPSESPDGSRVH